MNRLSIRSKNAAWATFVTAAALCLALAPAALAQDVAQVRAGSGGLDFLPVVEHGGFVLTVSGPEGFHHRAEFGTGESPSFSIFDHAGGVLPDGIYKYELRVVPSHTQRREAFEANQVATKAGAGLERPVQSGAFSIIGGAVVAGGETEPGAGPGTAGPVLNTKDQVIPDDLIVQGSLCVGFDCVNNEAFGFDTIRLKENNTRIKFEDTSTAAGFPSADWQLTANDSASGGLNKFSIEQTNVGLVPFTVEGGASNNSLYVDTGLRVGVGTSTPVLNLHVATSNTPGLRLEQTNAGGFTAQTWDVAGNEANFFVRSVTTGSQLPFRIRPGAPTSSIDIAANGNVGIGTASPSQPLHVTRSNGTTKLLVEETSTAEAARELAQFSNNGTVTYRFTDTQGTATEADDFNWIAGLRTNNQFIITLVGTIGSPLWFMDSSGNVTATSFNPSSSRTLKDGFAAIEPREVLDRVISLPISEWRYKDDVSDARHLGPVAEDFRQAFELGADDRHISLTDLGGVSLAAIQGLNEVVQEKDREIEELRAELAELKQLVLELAERGGAE